MAPETILDNRFVTLVYHPDTQIIHHVYKRGIGDESLKEALNTGLEVLKEKGARKWLSDNRLIGGHTDEETEWINRNWLPRAIEGGWSYWALVLPDNLLARLNMTEFVNSFYDQGVTVRVFKDADEAMAWLEQA